VLLQRLSLTEKSHNSFVKDDVPYDGWNNRYVIVMLYCKKDDFAKEIKSCSRYLSVANPIVLLLLMAFCNACKGHIRYRIKPILVGGGTDGALVNISRQSSIKPRVHTLDILELVLRSLLGTFIKGWLVYSAISGY